MNIQCPICNGDGKIEISNKYIKNEVLMKNRAVKILRKNGYGLRQIQRLLKYKSPRSISVILGRIT